MSIKRNTVALAVGVVSFAMLMGQAQAKEEVKNMGQYNCIEIEKFYVDRDNFSNKEKERAASMPDEELNGLQHAIVGEVTRHNLFQTVAKSDKKECQNGGLVFGGQVTDYKQGSRAARILIGFGAGKQKFEVEAYLKDKATGNIVAKKTIVDRKVGGLAGGDEAKGRNDFAEKVAAFIQEKK